MMVLATEVVIGGRMLVRVLGFGQTRLGSSDV
jgi:hypothetical protein